MWAVFYRKIETNRRIWFWTSLIIFIALGLIDPDRREIGKMDLPPLLIGLAKLLRPSTWADFFPASSLIPLHERLFALGGFFLFLGGIVAIYGMFSAFLGWFFHIPVVFILRHRRAHAMVNQSVVEDVPEGPVIRLSPLASWKASWPYAIVGAMASFFLTFVSGYSGIQFRFVYKICCEISPVYHSMQIGPSFLGVFVFLMIANGLITASLRPLLSSAALSKRLVGYGLLGLQLASIITYTGNTWYKF